MNADDLVAGLRQRGFQVRLREGKLAITPGSWLTDADRAALTSHRRAVVDLLRIEAQSPPPGACGLCRTTAWTWAADWDATVATTSIATTMATDTTIRMSSTTPVTKSFTRTTPATSPSPGEAYGSATPASPGR